MNEARYNIIKANKDAAESEELEVKRKALCVDAAPAYWKRRIEEGKELTKVVFLQTSTTRRTVSIIRSNEQQLLNHLCNGVELMT